MISAPPPVNRTEYGLSSLFSSLQAAEPDLETLLQGTAKLFQASGATLFLLDAVAGEYLLAASFGTGKGIPINTQLQSGKGFAGSAIATGKPELLNDVSSRHGSAFSALVVPLASPKSGVIGVLNISRKKGAAKYREPDLEKAISVANVLSFLFHNTILLSRLDEANQKFETILSNLNLATFFFDSKGEVTDINHLARDMADGRTFEEVLARLPIEVANSAKLALSGGATKTEVRTAAKRTFQLSIVRIPDGGAIMTLEDITLQRETMRTLAQSKRMAEIGQMTATIAHEIRNPLTAIRSAGKMIETNPEMGPELGMMIQEEAIKLCLLCDEFLHFSASITLSKKEVNLAELLRRIVQQHQLDANAAKVSLVFEAVSDKCIVVADPLRMEQVARNLILNAIQASPVNGTVTVSAQTSGFSVADGGSGVPLELAAKIFTPFFTTKSKGTGLGLPMVLKVMEAHGGTIEYLPQKVGSIFKVEFTGGMS